MIIYCLLIRKKISRRRSKKNDMFDNLKLLESDSDNPDLNDDTDDDSLIAALENRSLGGDTDDESKD